MQVASSIASTKWLKNFIEMWCLTSTESHFSSFTFIWENERRKKHTQTGKKNMPSNVRVACSRPCVVKCMYIVQCTHKTQVKPHCQFSVSMSRLHSNSIYFIFSFGLFVATAYGRTVHSHTHSTQSVRKAKILNRHTSHIVTCEIVRSHKLILE